MVVVVDAMASVVIGTASSRVPAAGATASQADWTAAAAVLEMQVPRFRGDFARVIWTGSPEPRSAVDWAWAGSSPSRTSTATSPTDSGITSICTPAGGSTADIEDLSPDASWACMSAAGIRDRFGGPGTPGLRIGDRG